MILDGQLYYCGGCIMAEQKAKPATKKSVPGKTSSAAAVKPKPAKVTAAAAAKKVAAKKSAVPAVKKAAASAASKKVPVKKTTAAGTKPAAKKPSTKLTPEERYRMVQTAAYFIAERNGFGGCSTDHWATAEIEIASLLGQ